MKKNLRCPACGRSRKPGHEKRAQRPDTRYHPDCRPYQSKKTWPVQAWNGGVMTVKWPTPAKRIKKGRRMKHLRSTVVKGRSLYKKLFEKSSMKKLGVA